MCLQHPDKKSYYNSARIDVTTFQGREKQDHFNDGNLMGVTILTWTLTGMLQLLCDITKAKVGLKHFF